MNREQLANALRNIADKLDNRVEIWIQVVDPSDHFGGTLAERIYQGSFQRQPGSHVGDRPTQEPTQEKQT